MSRSTIFVARPTTLTLVLGFTACSLQVPTEAEVFPSRTTSTNTTNTKGGNASHSGGSAGENSVGGDGGGDGGTDGGSGGSNQTANQGGSTTSGGVSSTGGTSSTGGASSTGGTTATTVNPLSIGLVAHYPFNEASGTIANNAINPSKNGTYQGTVTHPTGKFGLAAGLRNSGSTDYVELPPELLGGLSATTISLWFKNYSNTRQGGRLYDFGKGGTSHLRFVPYLTKSVGDYELTGIHNGTTFVSMVSANGTNLADAVWHNVTVTWDSAEIALYLDGVLKSTKTSPVALPSDITPTAPTWLGYDGDASYYALYAEIDDLRIYDRVLSQELITSLANGN